MAKGKKITLPSADHGPPEKENWKDRRPEWNGWNVYSPQRNAIYIDKHFPKTYKIHPDRNQHWFCFYNYYRYSCPFYHDPYRTTKPFGYHALAKQHVNDWLDKHPNDSYAKEHLNNMIAYSADGEIVTGSGQYGSEVIEYKPKPTLILREMSAEQKSIEAQSSVVPNNLGDQTFPNDYKTDASFPVCSLPVENVVNAENLDTYMSNDQFIEYLKEQNKKKEAQIEILTKERKMFTSELMELIRRWIK